MKGTYEDGGRMIWEKFIMHSQPRFSQRPASIHLPVLSSSRDADMYDQHGN